MAKFILKNHAGHQFEQEGRTLMEAKMKLCRSLGVAWNDLETGVTTLHLVRKMEEARNCECI